VSTPWWRAKGSLCSRAPAAKSATQRYGSIAYRLTMHRSTFGAGKKASPHTHEFAWRCFLLLT